MKMKENTNPFYKDMFDMLIQEAPVSMYILKESTFLYVNKQFCELVGYSEQAILSGEVLLEQLIHPDDIHIVKETIERRINGIELKSRYRVRFVSSDGSVLKAEIHATNILQNGEHTVCGTLIDVTEEEKAQMLLNENKERFKSLFYQNPDAVFTFDMTGKFVDANTACEELTGYNHAELLEMSFTPLILSEDLATAISCFEGAIQGITGHSELALTRKDGERRQIDVTAFPMTAGGKIVGAYGIAKDITEKIKYQKEMEDLAFYDSLTKLPNRKLFEDRLQQVIKWADTRESKPAVLFLDLDRFKFINDSLGHHVGDEFLKLVSDRLRLSLRKTDTVARIAGDEFAILLANTNHEEATGLAERLSEALTEPFTVMGHSVTVSASIGIAFNSDPEESVIELIKKADTAMYYAKKYGNLSYSVYSEELDMKTTYKLKLERDLRTAITNKQFTLHYQPIINLTTGQMKAMEALIRWNHPEFGFVPPDTFIPISEESGMIIPIGLWVLETACVQNKKWQEEGHEPFKISVNISTIQLQHPQFIQTVETVLKNTGLDPKWLELEVTESILMEDTKFLKDSLTQLKKLGVSMSIDDFGTGYTSLSYLRQFSFDRVKIDRSFIQDISTDQNGKAITSTIIELAHKLNMGVIAEGIEDETQLAFLQNEQCDEGQGYLFSRPLSAELHKMPLQFVPFN